MVVTCDTPLGFVQVNKLRTQRNKATIYKQNTIFNKRYAPTMGHHQTMCVKYLTTPNHVALSK